MLPDNAYMVIQAFMRDELHLEKTELLVYAVIHGFSQGGDGRFVGTNEFLSEWTGASERSVRAAISSLAESGLIEKGQAIINGTAVRTLKTTPAKIAATGKNCREGGQKLPQGAAKTATPYISKNINEKDREKDIPPISPASAILNDAAKEIIDYLNEKANASFKATTRATRRLISARMNEGFYVADFKAVIDCKVDEWGRDKRMAQYLRPETLFSAAHFESYLNQARRASEGVSHAVDSEWDDVGTVIALGC